MFEAKDMKGELPDVAALGSWDKRNRELCKLVVR
jgi:hypothetical protein